MEDKTKQTDKVRVKIIRCNNDDDWYQDQVGNIITLNDYHSDGFHGDYYHLNVAQKLRVLKSDCILIPEPSTESVPSAEDALDAHFMKRFGVSFHSAILDPEDYGWGIINEEVVKFSESFADLLVQQERENNKIETPINSIALKELGLYEFRDGHFETNRDITGNHENEILSPVSLTIKEHYRDNIKRWGVWLTYEVETHSGFASDDKYLEHITTIEQIKKLISILFNK